MATVEIGTHSCTIVESTEADSTTAAYSFSTPYGSVSGVVYKATGAGWEILLPDIDVHLLRSTSQPSLYAVMVEDPDFWGTLIAPYPPEQPPFTEDIEMGYTLNLVVQKDGVATNGEDLIFVFTGTDEHGNEGLDVWLNGMGVNTGTGQTQHCIETATQDGQVGTAVHVRPKSERLVFPRGEGARCQRQTDFRDASTETAAAGHRWYVSSCTAYYLPSGETVAASANVPLDGTQATLNYATGTIHVTGDANRQAVIYARALGTEYGFQNGYYEPVTLDGSGEADVEGLPAGHYVVMGYDDDENDEFTHFSAPVEVTLGWGATETAALTHQAFAADGEGLYHGYWFECPGEPLANAAVKCGVMVYDYACPVDCYEVTLGTTDANGYGPVGHDESLDFTDDCTGFLHDYQYVFVEDSDLKGFKRAPIDTTSRPFHSVGARVVIKVPHMTYEYHGVGAYDALQGQPGGIQLRPGDNCPSGQGVVRFYQGANNYLYSDPVPRYAGPHDFCADPDLYLCVWELWSGETKLTDLSLDAHYIGGNAPGSIPDGEPDAGNMDFAYDVAGRLRGGLVDWSGGGLSAPQLPVDYGMEFGAWTQQTVRVMGLLQNPPENGAYQHPVGWTNHHCWYCGHPALHDPGDGSRWYCSHCARDCRAYFDLYPAAAGDYYLRTAIPQARTLSQRSLLRQAWYRPEDFDDSAGYAADGEPYRYQSKHVVMGTWDYAGGFSAGTSMSARGVAVSRDIGPAQPKISIVTPPSASVEIRIECERTDSSKLYAYGTVGPGDDGVVRFTHVLPDTTDDESDRRALARIYDADADGWPCTAGDAVNAVVNAWVRESGGDWELLGDGLSAGELQFVNDNPSYRHEHIEVTRTDASHYLAHLYLGGRQPHLFHDTFGLKWLFYVSDADVHWRRDEAWGDLRSDGACKEYGAATNDGVSSYPWADKADDGTLVLLRQYSTNNVYLRTSDDNAVTWSSDVAIATGEKPRGCLFNGRLYLTRISSGTGQVARTPVGDFAQLSTWPDGSTWKNIGSSDDAVAVDKDVGSHEVVFATATGAGIDLYVSDEDGEAATIAT